MRSHIPLTILLAGLFVLSLSSLQATQIKGKTAPKTKDKGEKSSPDLKQQQQNLAKLKGDIETIYKNSAVTPQQKQAVTQDLLKILSTANKPSQASVQTLAHDLTAFLADKKITPAEAMKLTQDVSAVLSSANISQQDAQKLLADVKTLLKATNMTQADIQILVQDVQAIVKTAQQNHPGLGSKKK